MNLKRLRLAVLDVGSDHSPLVLPPQAAQQKLRQASTNVKHWNVQMNRLMHPIKPGGEKG